MSQSLADAVLWPLEEALPALGGEDRVLYVNALQTEALSGFMQRGHWTLLQFFKPWAESLGERVSTIWPSDPYTHALVAVGRQQEEARGWIARAALSVKGGGWIVAAGANDAGGKRLKDIYTALGLQAQTASRYHCRIVRAQKSAAFDQGQAQAWARNVSLRLCGDTGFQTCPGLFSWNKIDAGSALLARHLPQSLAGKGADFGCGYGFLSRTVLQQNPQIERLYCADADSRAVEACRSNLQNVHADVRFVWADLTKPDTGLSGMDWIVMNPPFHEGKKTSPDIGRAFLRTVAQALKPGGSLYMVANSQLPYEAGLAAFYNTVRKIQEKNGYKIYHAIKPS